jgi:glycosidase
VVYEINTWVWLEELSQRAGHPLTLGTVPQDELDRLAGYGFDGLWLMGVWQRSPAGRQVALEHAGLQDEYQRALPDYGAEDVVGSPYSILAYEVDPHLGGDAGLAALRARLAELGLRLMLDFVPNHAAVDHRWLVEHPDWLVQGGTDSLARHPGDYFASDASGSWQVFAHGRDPYFAGWTDTVQIDYRSAGARRAMADILLAMAERSDGARCDMAMLECRDVFLRTWGGQFNPPLAEFWPAAMTDLQARHPGFLMLAEVYWDMEWDLQQQGFDYTYDKRLYDRLLEGDATAVRQHLEAGLGYQCHLARFIENHDERRAVEAFGVERSRAVAVLTLTLPGLRLLHEGQLEGRRVKLPVQLGRRQAEEPEPGLDSFYRQLLAALRQPVFHQGSWQLLQPVPGWVDNTSYRSIVAHLWRLENETRLVAVNLSATSAQCHLPLDLSGLAGRSWELQDLLHGQVYPWAGDDLAGRGLYIDLPAYGYHLFALVGR